MISTTEVAISQLDFEKDSIQKLQTNKYASDLWPVVYILSDGKKKLAYVGETTDALSRLHTHLTHRDKKKLTSVHLIASKTFNKSATLDIESNLIKYLSGDGLFQLLNANMGLANHNYYQKREVYWETFKDIWDQLRSEGIVRHSLEHINNSDLFKYSPYKSLTREQRDGLRQMLEGLLKPDTRSVLIEGGAGTGKTILAVFLSKLLKSDLSDFYFGEFGKEEDDMRDLILQTKEAWPDPDMALVVPMASFRNTLKQVFKNICGLKASMVIGPAEVIKKDYDIILVDEAHRLRKRANLGNYFGRFDEICRELGMDPEHTSELDWVRRQARRSVFFYDRYQSIKPSDVDPAAFEKLRHQPDTLVQRLQSQFRVRGGNAYVFWVEQLLEGTLQSAKTNPAVSDYDLRFFDALPDMVRAIKARDKEEGLSRLIAGYAWEWKSKKDANLFDIVEDGIQLQWNSQTSDWINSDGAVAEVGCIHTTQGYDLNYAGIIFGHEIDYDPVSQSLVVIKENYRDKNGRMGISDPEDLREYILNIYKTILLRGIQGTYIYACNPNLRAYLRGAFAKEDSTTEPRSTLRILPPDQVRPFENSIPVYDLQVSAGTFGDLQQPSDVTWIAAAGQFTPSRRLFACRVLGESMNKIIPNGSLCLFRTYQGGSRNGLIVLVEHTRFEDAELGSCYTIKEYQSKKALSEEGWIHNQIILHPRSSDEAYAPIVLEGDDLEGFRVIGVFEKVLG